MQLVAAPFWGLHMGGMCDDQGLYLSLSGLMTTSFVDSLTSESAGWCARSLWLAYVLKAGPQLHGRHKDLADVKQSSGTKLYVCPLTPTLRIWLKSFLLGVRRAVQKPVMVRTGPLRMQAASLMHGTRWWPRGLRREAESI